MTASLKTTVKLIGERVGRIGLARGLVDRHRRARRVVGDRVVGRGRGGVAVAGRVRARRPPRSRRSPCRRGHAADGDVVGRAAAGHGRRRRAGRAAQRHVARREVRSTDSLKTTVKLIGDAFVGSAWPRAWLIVTVGAVTSQVTVLSVEVEAVLPLPAASVATPAAIDAMTVPLVVMPVTATL